MSSVGICAESVPIVELLGYFIVCLLSDLIFIYLESFQFIFVGKPATLFDFNDPDWAPTLKLGHNKLSDVLSSQNTARHDRFVARRERISNQSTSAQMDNPCQEQESGTYSQTELVGNTIAAIQEELQRLLAENIKLKEKVASTTINEEFFKDNETVKEYTGLPNISTLTVLYNCVKEFIPHTGSSALTKFQQLILVLMRLRLNSSHFELAKKFGINRSTSSKIFLNVLDILFTRLQPLIYWPNREQLRETMPMCFRSHFQLRVAVVVDCFEVFIDRPSNLAARAQTWSSYKHHNTVKFLIGIAPQGVISYISKGWGGRSSDKHVMEHCGILNCLTPGDEVLADRGFNVADSVAMVGAQLSIPSYTRGRSQLSAVDVEGTRRIANARIHVERVIGSLRQKYTILGSTLPLEFLTSTDQQPCTLDKVAVVCCALTNLCPSVVPFD